MRQEKLTATIAGEKGLMGGGRGIGERKAEDKDTENVIMEHRTLFDSYIELIKHVKKT